MGLRELLNQNEKTATIGASLLVVGGLITAYLSAGQNGGPRPVSEGMAFFSTDDGKTWFADSISMPSPYKKDGKVAYRVFVWRVNDGEPFVSHLFRTSAVPAENVDTSRAPQMDRKARPSLSAAGGMEVKKPGTPDTAWVRAESPEGEAIAKPRGPDGTTNGLEMVEP